MGKAKKSYDNYQYYFGRSGNRDLLPAMVAFGGRLRYSEGDEVNADYMQILRSMCRQLRQGDGRIKTKNNCKLPKEMIL